MGRPCGKHAAAFEQIALELEWQAVARYDQVELARPVGEPGEVVGHGEWNVLLAEDAKESAIACLASAQQQYTGRALLSGVEFGMLLVPFENRFCRQQSALVLLVQRPNHDERRAGAMRHVLIQPRPDLRRRHGHKPVGDVHESDRQVEGHLGRLRVAGAVHIVAGRVRPHRQSAIEGRIRFRCDAVHQPLDVRQERRPRTLLVNEIGDVRRHLQAAGLQKLPVGRIRRRGQVLAVPFAEEPLAALALAHPHTGAAVVRRRVSERVEEQPVHFVTLQRLGEDLQGVLPIVGPVDARRIEAVIDDRLPVLPAKEPLRMGVVNGLLRLAQIETADDADAAGVRFAQNLPERVAASGNEGAGVVEGDFGRVMGHDAAHAE